VSLPALGSPLVPDRTHSASTFARLLLGSFWLVLGSAKLAALVGIGSGGDQPWLPSSAPLACLELLVGLMVLLPRRLNRYRPLCDVLSCVLAAALAAYAWLVVDVRPCGCFGALGGAARWQRIVVALGLTYMSLDVVADHQWRGRLG